MGDEHKDFYIPTEEPETAEESRISTRGSLKHLFEEACVCDLPVCCSCNQYASIHQLTCIFSTAMRSFPLRAMNATFPRRHREIQNKQVLCRVSLFGIVKNPFHHLQNAALTRSVLPVSEERRFALPVEFPRLSDVCG